MPFLLYLFLFNKFSTETLGSFVGVVEPVAHLDALFPLHVDSHVVQAAFGRPSSIADDVVPRFVVHRAEDVVLFVLERLRKQFDEFLPAAAPHGPDGECEGVPVVAFRPFGRGVVLPFPSRIPAKTRDRGLFQFRQFRLDFLCRHWSVSCSRDLPGDPKQTADIHSDIGHCLSCFPRTCGAHPDFPLHRDPSPGSVGMTLSYQLLMSRTSPFFTIPSPRPQACSPSGKPADCFCNYGKH